MDVDCSIMLLCYYVIMLLPNFISSGVLESPGLLLSTLYNITSIVLYHHTNN